MKTRISSALALLLASSACTPGKLAEAAGRTFSVEEAAQLVADHSRIPIDTQVVRAVAELWVDYTLLADQVLQDTSLATLDMTGATREALEERMLGRLQEAVISFDTIVDDEELRSRFAREMPGARASASHILLAYPPNASTADMDSVARFAAQIRERLQNGESFATLAGRYSADQGSARFAGSLGTFERGAMLPPIDEAVFSLSPGNISEPVETTLGLHIVRVESIDVPDFDEVGGSLRAQVLGERRDQAEQAYFDELDRTAALLLVEDASVLARALAKNPLATLTHRAGDRALATFTGGVFTVGDFRTLIRNSAPRFPEGVLGASDEELETMLLSLGRQQMLVHEARERGFAPSEMEVDSVQTEARALILERARTIGLLPSPAQSDQPAPADAALEAALAALRRVVSGTQEIIPLAGITFLLREGTEWRIQDEAVRTTVSRALELQALGADGAPAAPSE